MSNAKTTPTVHAPGKPLANGTTLPLCGRWTKDSSCGDAVTCKRCLASLAKCDREFQRKARRGIGYVFRQPGGTSRRLSQLHMVGVTAGVRGTVLSGLERDAARAIAREEGRVL